MKCIICKNYSFKIICFSCQKNFLHPTLSTRVLPDGFKIHSFYRYSDIEHLLKTKHTHVGASIYKILANLSFRQFGDSFSFEEVVYALSIDDHVKHGYSHTAILSQALKSKNINPVFSSLRATNKITYSAKSLSYRLENPRNFKYSFKSDINAILVDDIVTTTTTINEAKNTLLIRGINPLFALTLADAKEA